MTLHPIFRNRFFLTTAAGVVLLGGFLGWLFFSSAVVGNDTDSYTLKIEKGLSFYGVTKKLVDQGILKGDFKLKATTKILAKQKELKAGKYEIQGGISSYSLLQQLTQGRVAVEKITIQEGLSARQIAQIFQRRMEIDSAAFMELVNDSNYANSLGINASSLEGYLYPETYKFHWGNTSKQIIARLVGEFKKNFNQTLENRADEIGFSINETITLASIIEGEAILRSEQSIISAVYHNRLNRGMRLQADPTIQYIITDGPRRLLKRDLEIDSPYNTYKHKGLPPGPIGNPGIESIKACLYPADVDYLYFVANGDGSHTFSRTFREHLRAKAKFDKYRREVQRKLQRKPKEG